MMYLLDKNNGVNDSALLSMLGLCAGRRTD